MKAWIAFVAFVVVQSVAAQKLEPPVDAPEAGSAEAIAKAAGTTMRNLVRVNYWLSDIREFPGVALAWAGRYGDAPHPFACVVTPRLPAPGATVDVTAARKAGIWKSAV